VYHTDGLGSVVAMTRSGGEIGELVLRAYSYEAFGKVRVETEAPFAPVNRYTYTARESIGDSLGLLYYRWRVMDPNVGRFTSEDPLGFVDGVNVFLYVANRPAIAVDPAGSATRGYCGYGCSRMGLSPFWFCMLAERVDCDDCPLFIFAERAERGTIYLNWIRIDCPRRCPRVA
jgi:RHS repeat-associated protein